jgi:4-amino-4-deoxy-L-arabinose transferase-like glycosyltransferase
MNRRLAVLLVLLFIGLSLGSSLSESLTFDEIVHAQEGVNALTKHTFLIDTNNPPLIRELAMLPTVLGAAKLFPPRTVIIVLGALTLIAVYRVTKRYFGRTQALFAMFLLALEPTFLANSHYVTLDTGTTLFFFIGYMAFVRFMERYSIRNFMISAIAWGLAFSSKMTLIPFLVISAGTVGLRKFRIRFTHLILFACIVRVVIWSTYFFTYDVVIASREDAGRVSSRLRTYAVTHNNRMIERILTFGETQKLPLGNYLAAVKNTLMWPKARARIFFLGEFYPSSRWYFMMITVLLKLPIPLLVLFILGLLASKRRGRIAIFAIPVVVILGITSFVNNQPWIRYVLPAVPFFVIVASHSIRWFSGPVRKICFLLVCLWYAWGTGAAFPHYISYANEFAGSRQTRYRTFMDSNLDWGQSLPDIAHYIKTVQPGFVSFSYFGRDSGDRYGLTSDMAYGSHRYEDICAFHHINLPYESTKIVVAISASNWYYCGYNTDPRFSGRPVKDVVGDSVLIFYE